MSKVPLLKGLKRVNSSGASDLEVNKIGAWERKRLAYMHNIHTIFRFERAGVA